MNETTTTTPHISTQPFPIERVYDHVMEIINQRPDADRLRASLAARLSDDLTRGAEKPIALRDTVRPEQHPHAELTVSPWAHPSVGANAVVTFKDTASGEIYLLLAQKYNDRTNPQAGYNPVLEIPGGHMEVRAPEGSTPKPFDVNLAHTSARELFEETGLALNPILATSLGTVSDFKRATEPSRQGLEEQFHYHMQGDATNLPSVQGKDDVAHAFWIKLSDIKVDRTLPKQERESGRWRYHLHVPQGDFPIRDDFGDAIELAGTRLGIKLDEISPKTSIIAANATLAGKAQAISPYVGATNTPH